MNKKHITDPFVIKLEPKEVGINELDNESYEASNEQEECIQSKSSDQEIINKLKQKIQKLENKLLVVSYRFKVKHAESMLIRKKQAKTIKSLNSKLNQFDELIGCLDKLCSNFNNLNVKNNNLTSNITKTINPSKSLDTSPIQIDSISTRILVATNFQSNNLSCKSNELTKRNLTKEKENQINFSSKSTNNQLKSNLYGATQTLMESNPINEDDSFNNDMNSTLDEISDQSTGKSFKKKFKPLGKIKFSRKLDKEIWKSFKNANISIRLCNKAQQNEISFITKSYEDFDKKKRIHSLTKNRIGYIFRFICAKRKCIWYLKIDISEDCAHVYTNETSEICSCNA